jgi:diacylglycerol kinase family enzyme
MDGTDLSNRIFSMNVGICRYNGGGMIQAPNAVPDDGLFDLTIINKLSKPRVILSLRRLYRGTIHKHPRVDSYTAKSIMIRSSDTILLETDGESLGHTPVEFLMIPKSVRILTGAPVA